MSLNIYFLRYALPNSEIINDHLFVKKEISGININSRTIKKNEIFLAFKGQNFDGHDFIENALDKGALGLIIDRNKEKLLEKIPPEKLQDKLIIKVSDTFKALTGLAKNYRQRFDFNIIGITGSVGKTTTKEILANILKTAKIPAYVSYKNQNNSIGLSLNILKMETKHKLAVFELGISHVGDMDELVDILRPTMAVVTRIGIAHSQGLGNVASITEQKLKIFKHFDFANIGFVCGDQEKLCSFQHDYPIIKFGLKTKNHIQARKVALLHDSSKFILKIYKNRQKIELKGNHPGFVNNVLAATSVAQMLNISFTDIVVGLQSYDGFENRFEIKTLKENNGVIISDCYNASPDSMKAALLAFGKMECQGPRIAVLGDMLELGERQVYWHRQIGRVFGKVLNIDRVILVGKLAKNIAKTLPVTIKFEFAQDWQQAQEKLSCLLQNNSEKKPLVLVKASRGVGLDNLIKELSI